MESQLEAAEIWFLRRMLRIAWTDKVSNDQVRQRANTSRNLLKVIVSRQIRFVGHVMRKNQLEAVALTGMIEGKRARGRQRKTFMDWISTACGDKWNVGLWSWSRSWRKSLAVFQDFVVILDSSEQGTPWHFVWDNKSSLPFGSHWLREPFAFHAHQPQLRGYLTMGAIC